MRRNVTERTDDEIPPELDMLILG